MCVVVVPRYYMIYMYICLRRALIIFMSGTVMAIYYYYLYYNIQNVGRIANLFLSSQRGGGGGLAEITSEEGS